MNNPPAFPQLHQIDGNWNKEPSPQYAGLTALDYFSAAALTGLLHNESFVFISLAKDAFDTAEAVLSERERRMWIESIKPEPREWWVVLGSGNFFSDKEEAEKHCRQCGFSTKPIHVGEIIKEEKK